MRRRCVPLTCETVSGERQLSRLPARRKIDRPVRTIDRSTGRGVMTRCASRVASRLTPTTYGEYQSMTPTRSRHARSAGAHCARGHCGGQLAAARQAGLPASATICDPYRAAVTGCPARYPARCRVGGSIMTLCAACRAEEQRWIHIDPRTARGIAIASNRPAIDTIRSQVKLIREGCKAAGHVV